MNRPTGNFIWYELMTSDVAAAERFYATVVGWTPQASGQPGMDYRLWTIGGTQIGGLMAIPPEAAAGGMRPAWVAYIKVADVDATLAALTAAGGTACMPPTDIPNVGRIGMVMDPQGAAFYIMAPAHAAESNAYAPGKIGHAGWHELHAKDNRAALAFYEGLLGWGKHSEMDMGPMGAYILFENGDGMIGGMMTNPQIPHPAWLTYFCVGDIDAAKSRVEQAGGQVVMGPMAVPGDGWVLQAIDPQGAMFALVGNRAG